MSKNAISGNIIIFHAGSLSVPFQEIARAFEQENSDMYLPEYLKKYTIANS